MEQKRAFTSRVTPSSPLSGSVLRSPVVTLAALALAAAITAACSASGSRGNLADGASSSGSGSGAPVAATSSSTASGAGGGVVASGDTSGTGGGIALPAVGCSSDRHTVVDALGDVVETCSGLNGCDPGALTCDNACQGAIDNRLPVGCEYYATDMDQFSEGLCFAAFVANNWDVPVHIQVEYQGVPLPVADFARIPSGAGPSLTYGSYDPTAGLPSGQVAILFLAGSASSGTPCPVSAAVPAGAQIFQSTGVGSSFHITTDVPVVSYQINPYGGGSAAVTGASLLLPTSVWDTNYVAVTAAPYDPEINATGAGVNIAPSINIIAAEDGTQITLLPSVAVDGGGTLPAGAANALYTFTLDRGQQAQFTQPGDLTGTVIQSNKPIGLMAGHPCMRTPLGVGYCDHGEQMIPPVKALGNEYAGVMFRPRRDGRRRHLARGRRGRRDGAHLHGRRRRPLRDRRGGDGQLRDGRALRRQEPGRGPPLHALRVHERVAVGRREAGPPLRHHRLRRRRLRPRRAPPAVRQRLRVLRRPHLPGDQPRRHPRARPERAAPRRRPRLRGPARRAGRRSATTNGRASASSSTTSTTSATAPPAGTRSRARPPSASGSGAGGRPRPPSSPPTSRTGTRAG